MRRNPQILKSAKIPEQWSESDSEDFDALLTDVFTFTPEPLVDAEEETSKYPSVPADYPFTPIWQRSEEERAQIPPERLEAQELLSMAMVKLWSEGDYDFTDGVITNGAFYPLYPDVAYVEWDEREAPDGTIYWSVGNVLTTSRNDSSKIMDQLNNGKIPEGIRIVDYKSAGIDPYQLLSK